MNNADKTELLNRIGKLEKELENFKKGLYSTEESINPDTCVGVTSKGETIVFNKNPQGLVDCTDKDLVSLEVGSNIKYLHCHDNLLERLVIPKSVCLLDCCDNKLKELEIMGRLKGLHCSNNELRELTLCEGLQLLNCRDNFIRELNVPTSVKSLVCSGNPFKSLTIPDNFNMKRLLTK